MNIFKRLVRDSFYVFAGFVLLLIVKLFIILSIPVYIYRWLICKIIAPFFSQKIGKAVNSFGVTFGFDYSFKDFHLHPSKSTIVGNTIIDGIVDFDEFVNKVEKTWLQAELSPGVPQYPELKQFVERWMGFLFWKHDHQFNLSNHVVLHKLTCNEEESERFIIEKIETLLNSPFYPKRSPWEVHIVQGYRNSNCRKIILGDGLKEGDMTVIMLKYHHIMGDGFSMSNAMLKLLCGKSFNPPTPPPSPSKGDCQSCLRIIKTLTFPLRLCYDVGAGYANSVKPQMSSPWHLKGKSWRNIHARAELIPVEKVAFIKNKLGVSFTAVLFSSMARALEKCVEENREVVSRFKRVKYFPVCPVLILKGSRDKMRNRMTTAIIDLPIGRLSSKDRLMLTEKAFVKAKSSTSPLIAPLIVKAFGSHLPCVASSVIENRIIAAGLSNIPGPNVKLECDGKRLLSTDFAFNHNPGVAGFGFHIASFAGNLRISATAEVGVMNREGLTQIIQYACEELDTLYNLAVAPVPVRNGVVSLEIPESA